jgi:hypothetical protein
MLGIGREKLTATRQLTAAASGAGFVALVYWIIYLRK